MWDVTNYSSALKTGLLSVLIQLRLSRDNGLYCEEPPLTFIQKNMNISILDLSEIPIFLSKNVNFVSYL